MRSTADGDGEQSGRGESEAVAWTGECAREMMSQNYTTKLSELWSVLARQLLLLRLEFVRL